ncbi:MAG: hypothetical protein LC104_07510 [Bacteroidales bacterium]|nr:hypothetical protein [Bacteroidales bacterium]
MFSRVFGLSPVIPSPSALTAHLHAAGVAVVPHFRGDDLGWTAGELHLPAGGTPVYLERYLTREDNLRPDLNTFAAEIETCDYSAHVTDLMRRMIQTEQLITMRKPVDQSDEAALETVLVATCRYLAQATDGVYQMDGLGWFAADGTLLIQEY